MQKAFSLPQNEDFFNRYATLVPTLSKLGVFAQIINGLTEFGIINAVVLSHIVGLFGVFSVPLAIVAAIFGVIILEMGQRTFLPYAARAVLHRRFKGLDCWMSVFIFAVTVCLFGASLYLSFRGSRDLVEAVAPPPALLNVARADSTLTAAKNEAEQAYNSECKEINTRYAGLIEATRNSTAAQVTAHRTQLQQITAKEQRTGQRYTTERNVHTNAIKSIEATGADRVAVLEQDRAKELAAAKEHRHTATGAATDARAKTEAENEKTSAAHRTKISSYGGGLGWLTVIFHLVLLLSIVLDEMHKKGSGIELRAAPTQYHFSQSIFALLMNTITEKWNYYSRNKIQKWADKTPAPERPKTPHPLHDAPTMAIRRTVPPELLKEAQKATNSTGKHHTATQNFSATERIRVNIPYTAPAYKFNWNAPLSEPIVTSVNNATVNTDHFNKECAHCGTPFYAKVAWQKYCREQCKLDAHEAKHGARFEPSKAKYKKTRS